MAAWAWLWCCVACAPTVEVDTSLDCWRCAETTDTTEEDSGTTPTTTPGSGVRAR